MRALMAVIFMIPLAAQAQSWNQQSRDPAYDIGPQACSRSYGGCEAQDVDRLMDQARQQERDDQAHADHFWALTDPSDR